MTTLELWLICILCYILIGIIWAIAHFFKKCNDAEKNIDQDQYGNPVRYDYEKPTTIDGILVIFLWPLFMLYMLCLGVVQLIYVMTDFLEEHKNLFEHEK